MKILSIGTDRKVFNLSSPVRSRLVKIGNCFDKYVHIIFCKKKLGLEESGDQNVVFIPTNSTSKILYLYDAFILASKVIKEDTGDRNWFITAQDPFECGLVAYLISRRFKLPLQLQIHTDFLNPYFSRLTFLNRVRVFFAKILLPKADRVRVVSKKLSEEISKSRIRLRKDPDILPVYTESNFSKLSGKVLRNEKGTINILSVGRLTKEKDFSSAVEVVYLLKSWGVECVLSIVGDGPLKDKLIGLAVRKGVIDYVRFVGWQDNISSYYSEADIYLSTSKFEGFGLSLLEAAMNGLPIVSTEVGIVNELVESKFAHSIAGIGDCKQLALSVTRLIADPELYNAYSKSLLETSRRYVVSDINDYIKKYRAIFD
jgi:glycosyltransferase involved in cell wall biosynthesis